MAATGSVRLRRQRDHARAQVAAARALHAPTLSAPPRCRECSRIAGGWREWPCSTAAVIDQAGQPAITDLSGDTL